MILTVAVIVTVIVFVICDCDFYFDCDLCLCLLLWFLTFKIIALAALVAAVLSCELPNQMIPDPDPVVNQMVPVVDIWISVLSSCHVIPQTTLHITRVAPVAAGLRARSALHRVAELTKRQQPTTSSTSVCKNFCWKAAVDEEKLTLHCPGKKTRRQTNQEGENAGAETKPNTVYGYKIYFYIVSK